MDEQSIFEALGGYADLPLMEDVDLIRRLRRQGRLLFPAAEVRTSARRWQRDGWVRRSATNVTLLAGYALGASPARLAQHYFHRRPSAVVVMARAPWTGGKTRIQAGDAHAHAALREALLLDTLDAVRSAAVGDVLVACDPPSETERMRTTIGGGSDLFAQRGESLGARMAHAFEDAFRLGYESVLLIGSDLPDLPARVLSAGWTWLARARGQVVLGPAADGGYYLIGLTRPHPELFEGIEWSTGTVLQETEAIAARLGLASNRVDQWWDVDTADDLERLSHSATGGAERTRAWILRHGAEVIAGRR